MSEDEFDDIPDEFAGIEGINWTDILSCPPPSTNPPQSTQGNEEDDAILRLMNQSPNVTNTSTQYSWDDDVFDNAFLTELDSLERSLTQPPVPSSSQITGTPLWIPKKLLFNLIFRAFFFPKYTTTISVMWANFCSLSSINWGVRFDPKSPKTWCVESQIVAVCE